MNYVQLAGREVKENGRHPSQHLRSASWPTVNVMRGKGEQVYDVCLKKFYEQPNNMGREETLTPYILIN